MTTREKPATPLEEAIKLCGNQEELGRRIGQSQQVISYWKRKGTVSAELAVAIEAATGISRAKLRPDIFGERAQ